MKCIYDNGKIRKIISKNTMPINKTKTTYMLTTAIGLLLGRQRANETKLRRVDVSFWDLKPRSDLGSATKTLNGSS